MDNLYTWSLKSANKPERRGEIAAPTMDIAKAKAACALGNPLFAHLIKVKLAQKNVEIKPSAPNHFICYKHG